MAFTVFHNSLTPRLRKIPICYIVVQSSYPVNPKNLWTIFDIITQIFATDVKGSFVDNTH